MMGEVTLIDRLARMLNDAADIIREQAELLELHGISAEGCEQIAARRQKLLEDIETHV